MRRFGQWYFKSKYTLPTFRLIRGQTRVFVCIWTPVAAVTTCILVVVGIEGLVDHSVRNPVGVLALGAVFGASAVFSWRHRRWWWPPVRREDGLDQSP